VNNFKFQICEQFSDLVFRGELEISLSELKRKKKFFFASQTKKKKKKKKDDAVVRARAEHDAISSSSNDTNTRNFSGVHRPHDVHILHVDERRDDVPMEHGDEGVLDASIGPQHAATIHDFADSCGAGDVSSAHAQA
jgi:hypothetical protein